MDKAAIVPQMEYAFREKRIPGAPLEHIRILEHIRGNKWKAEWIEPNPVSFITPSLLSSPLLNEYRASWALIRQWASHDPAVAQREAEIGMLERLVWDAIYALEKAGLDSEAARLRRVMERKR